MDYDDRSWNDNRKWNPALHPRRPKGSGDPSGEFIKLGGGGGGIKLPDQPVSAGGVGPVKLDPSITSAVKALEAGKNASISQGDFAALMDQLGDEDDSVNLARLSVTGKPNLFTKHAREIPRSQMPQLPGSVDEIGAFADALNREGITAELRDVDPTALHMTQNQLDSKKVAKLYHLMAKNGWQPGAVLMISKDGDILDGHHRWAGASAAAAAGHPIKVTALQANADIDTLLRIANTVSGPRKAAPRAYTRAGGQALKFGEKPTTPPPSKDKPWIWIGGKWVLLVTDTEDGVPSSLANLK